MDMKIVLVRLGQTEWNGLHKVQGHKNSNLTEKGIAQTDLVVRLLFRVPFQHFICNDSGRAVQTAERILAVRSQVVPLRHDKRLRELDYGDWEGLQNDESTDTLRLIQERCKLVPRAKGAQE
jgi:probable phosphoglycerate mutase